MSDDPVLDALDALIAGFGSQTGKKKLSLEHIAIL
jgi:hypothetical protein